MRRIAVTAAAVVALAGCGTNHMGESPYPAGGASSPRAAVRALYESTTPLGAPLPIAFPDDRSCPSHTVSRNSGSVVIAGPVPGSPVDYVETRHPTYTDVSVVSPGSSVTQAEPYQVVEHDGRYFVC